MIKKGVIFLLLISIVFCCACSSKNDKNSAFQLKETTYNELNMKSLINTDLVTRIEIFYMGKLYTLGEKEQLDNAIEKWDKSILTNAKVSLINDKVAPGFLYSITMKEDNKEIDKVREYGFTVVSNVNTIELHFVSSDQKNYKIVGFANDSFNDFLKACENTFN